MTRTPDYMGIKPEAWCAWLALTDALHALEDDGTPPVCQQQPDLWSGDAKSADQKKDRSRMTDPVFIHCIETEAAQDVPR